MSEHWSGNAWAVFQANHHHISHKLFWAHMNTICLTTRIYNVHKEKHSPRYFLHNPCPVFRYHLFPFTLFLSRDLQKMQTNTINVINNMAEKNAPSNICWLWLWYVWMFTAECSLLTFSHLWENQSINHSPLSFSYFFWCNSLKGCEPRRATCFP